MIISQDAIGQLADRIERAYRRRYPSWKSVGVTPGAWESAAARLLGSSDREPSIPIDPEFFVAVQDKGRCRPQPWEELTQQHALDRYQGAIRTIIGQLREELRSELRRADRRLLRGLSLEKLAAGRGGRISALSLYILAHRAGRLDLATALRDEVEEQHRSCPLYRSAAEPFLPVHAYPLEGAAGVDRLDREAASFSVN